MAARYRRILRHRGHKKAIVAVAHNLLVTAYHVLASQTVYQELGAHYYDRLDIALREEDRERIWKRAEDAHPDAVAGIKVTESDRTDGFRFILGDKGWLLLRFSGTEPLVRIYTEVVGDESLVQRVLADGREIVGV